MIHVTVVAKGIVPARGDNEGSEVVNSYLNTNETQQETHEASRPSAFKTHAKNKAGKSKQVEQAARAKLHVPPEARIPTRKALDYHVL